MSPDAGAGPNGVARATKEQLTKGSEQPIVQTDIGPSEEIAELGQTLEESRLSDAQEAQPLSQEEITAKFHDTYEKVSQIYETARMLEEELKELAKLGGTEYVPAFEASSTAKSPVVEKPLSRPTEKLIAKFGGETATESQNTRVHEIGQVVVDATRERDSISERAFESTTPDTRENRRVSQHAHEVHERPVAPTPLSLKSRMKNDAQKVWDTVTEDLTKAVEHFEKKDEDLSSSDESGKSAEITPISKKSKELVVVDAENTELVPLENKPMYGLSFEGKPITFVKEESMPNGDVFFTFKDEDGNERTELKNKITLSVPPRPSELPQNPNPQAVEVAQQEEEAEKAGIVERTKNWLSKKREQYGIHYWHAKYMAADDYLGDKTSKFVDKGLNYKVTDTMTEDEKQERRDKNRLNIKIGVGVLGGLVVGYAFANLVNEVNEAHAAVTAGGLPKAPTFSPESNIIPDLNQSTGYPEGYNPSMQFDGGAIEAAPPAAPVLSFEAFSNPNYNIPNNGMGGEQLFGSLNINPAKFYEVQDYLHTNWPASFYQEPGQPVELNIGWIPADAQKYIESLRG